MKSRPKVAIIGGGASGLITAWLIEEKYQVTVFEKEVRAGGHAKTFNLHLHGKIYPINYQFGIFTKGYPLFCGLLDILGVRKKRIKMTVNLYDRERIFGAPLPFFGINGHLLDRVSIRYLKSLLKLRKFIILGNALTDESITMEEFAESLPFTRKEFNQHFLYPLLSTIWGMSLESVRSTSAHMICSYMYENKFHQFFTNDTFEVDRGSMVYIHQLMQALQTAHVRVDAEVEQVYRKDGQWVVCVNGGEEIFDEVVFATNGRITGMLLKNEPEYAQTFQKFKTVYNDIVIHSDSSVLPEATFEWSRYTEFYNPKSPKVFSIVWMGHSDDGVPLFVTARLEDPDLLDPSKIYNTIQTEHPWITKDGVAARAWVKAHQGDNNLWFVGAYITGDCMHESAVRSAVDVAKKMCPESVRLKLLQKHSHVPFSLHQFIKDCANYLLALPTDLIIGPLFVRGYSKKVKK